MLRKKIALLLIVLQVAGSAVDAAVVDGFAAVSDNTLTVESTLSTTVALVNQGFGRQLRLLTTLSDFASKLGDTTPQKKPEKKSSPDKASLPQISLKSFDGLRYSHLTPFTTQRSLPAHSVILLTFILYLMSSSFLHVRRLTFSKFIFLLPRGSIDDHIRNINHIFRTDPHCPKR